MGFTMIPSKVDVLIPTKDPSKIRPKLLEVLRGSDWVNKIILETSKPLSIARLIGAKKCSTSWIAMFDDDVEIPSHWFDCVKRYVEPGVVAVSTPSYDANNIHFYAYKSIADKIKPLYTRDTPFIDNTLICREVFFTYEPLPTFYCEDELLYRHAKRYGKWIHPPFCGVKHYYIQKDIVQGSAIMEQLHFYPTWRFVRGRLSYFIIPLLAVAYSRTLRTISFFWKLNVKILAGFLKAKFMRKGCL